MEEIISKKAHDRSFYDRVYDLVAQIPEGKVITYGHLAVLAGRPNGARAAGFAMRNVPIERHLPCHRVVFASGGLAPAYAFGGADAQRRQLMREGVEFLPSGKVDMRACRWK